mgnify:CR=1 FL=1
MNNIDISVVFILKSELELLPPIYTQILATKENIKGAVTVICYSCTNYLRDYLSKRNINVITISTNSNKANIALNSKIVKWIRCFYKIRLILRRIEYKYYIWVGSADTAICVLPELKKYKYVISIHELYDHNKFYKFMLKYITRNAEAVVVPEYNRAKIIKSWWGLSKTPYVFPNKPLPIKVERALMDDKFFKFSKREKYILYQGWISPDRDLKAIALALRKMNSDFILLLMGKEKGSSVEKIIDIYPKTKYLGYIAAPEHLLYTKIAYIGIAMYDDKSLNRVYCAPNKIYEYSMYGIPMICSDSPGLKYTVEASKSGICVDMTDIDGIVDAINEIDKNYSEYSNAAKSFYSRFDILGNNYKILSNIKNSEAS